MSWFVLRNFVNLYSTLCASSKFSRFSSESSLILYLTIILSADTYSTTPSASAAIIDLESLATISSKPVPTNGDCGLSRGTACLCILLPISALLASSCSRNGINAAAALTIWLVAMSMYSTSSCPSVGKSPLNLALTFSFRKLPLLSTGSFACAILKRSSISAERYSISFVTFPFTTFLYGVSMNPRSFTLA